MSELREQIADLIGSGMRCIDMEADVLLMKIEELVREDCCDKAREAIEASKIDHICDRPSAIEIEEGHDLAIKAITEALK